MKNTDQTLQIIEQDEWLRPCSEELISRHNQYLNSIHTIESDCGSIIHYANGHKYFGFNRDEKLEGLWYREWLPGAKEVYLFGDFNGWDRYQTPLGKGAGGVWSIFLSDERYGDKLVHESLVKILVIGDNGTHERIPAYIKRVVQDDTTKDFTGQLWLPKSEFNWTDDTFNIAAIKNPLIYECHIGMAQEEAKVGSYSEFTLNMLPKIRDLGYNTIQIMAISEHPYYGSFGYHVSNFFAPSSRFGTPEDLKTLIKSAHQMGIAVIMDVVHAHYVKNLQEGLNRLDGTDHHYSPQGDSGYQPYWDSMLFDYDKDDVVHFLLSNLKYWLEEFHFDGFRFDGVTSMLYKHHGYTEFDSREKYFDDTINRSSILYLTLANKLIHSLKPNSITIAEDVSGMPGMCYPIEDGGIGFDYRLGMAIPDFWIKLIKEVPDESWNIWDMWNILTNRLPKVKTISYAESHDQAMVGDQTIAFRLMKSAMYSDMHKDTQSIDIDRGLALHKMIKLITITLGGQGYMNFMGNEFGHPNWIDFPREGNNWSYEYARREWSLIDNDELKYIFLQKFDTDMIKLVKEHDLLNRGYAYNQIMDEGDQTMAYSIDDLVFVFNWSPTQSFLDYSITVPSPGTYREVLSTDSPTFGGQGRQLSTTRHFSNTMACEDGTIKHFINIYNTSRSATVYIKESK